MGFDTPAGTRGARQPSGLFFRWLNTVMARRLRRKGGKMMGFRSKSTAARYPSSQNSSMGWSETRHGSRSPTPRPASLSTGRRPTASCRSSAWLHGPVNRAPARLAVVAAAVTIQAAPGRPRPETGAPGREPANLTTGP
jgi:hypothetical protein